MPPSINEILPHGGLTDLSDWLGDELSAMWLAKAIGAFAGSLVSLAYVMPKGRREAVARLFVGLLSGLIFGGTVGVKLADAAGLLHKVSAFEIALMGATLASLCAWWSLGALHRIVERWPSPSVTRKNEERSK